MSSQRLSRIVKNCHEILFKQGQNLYLILIIALNYVIIGV